MTELPIEKIINIRKEKIEKMNKSGIDPYPSSFDYTHTVLKIQSDFGDISPGEKTTSYIKTCGRVISFREMGKSTFCHIMDSTGKLQIYLREDVLKQKYSDFLSFIDIGDHIGVGGEVFKTKTGELSIDVKDWVILSKSLRPLPEKWHGLKDVELRYRQRYLDLISNPKIKQIYITRMNIISLMREFLNSKGFVEVETPILQTLPGGALAKPFKTYHNALGIDLYLRIAPELYLKMLIIGGFDRIYEIGKSFRNEGVDSRHNPEFTMLEIYQTYADYLEMMDLCEDMICFIFEKLKLNKINYNGMEVEIKKPFNRISLQDLISEELGVGIEELINKEKIVKLAQKLDIKTDIPHKKIFDHIFQNFIQKKLIQPTFIYDYPIIFSPLAKRKNDILAQRFELFIATEEIANAYTELNDPQEQLERFKQQQELRESGDEETHEFDKNFLLALEYGMPPTVGLGIGIDRLTMIFTSSPSIREVIFFPLQKPQT